MHNDSQLVIGQVNGTFAAKNGNMKEYLAYVLELTHRLQHFLIKQIP